jgi:hypothetical protein
VIVVYGMLLSDSCLGHGSWCIHVVRIATRADLVSFLLALFQTATTTAIRQSGELSQKTLRLNVSRQG